MPVREQQYVKVHEGDTLAVAFAKRVALSPIAVAYREYDASEQLWQAYSWSETAEQAGRVRAALDVTDPEPLPADHPLWSAPGVLISPHVGGNTTAFLPRAYRLVAAQLRCWRDGVPLDNAMTRP